MKHNITHEQFKIACDSSNGTGEVLRNLKLSENGNNRKIVRNLSQQFDIPLPAYTAKRVWSEIEKSCPVCEKTFVTLKGHKNEKRVCSHSCSNTYFRSRENNPNYKNGFNGDKDYRIICFSHHEKKCCICGFDYIVEVHHLDCDNTNNDPNNLIPLCSNHHRMYHSRYRQLVSPLIDEYIKNRV